MIQITADDFGFHWAAFQENKSILDSSKQGGFDDLKSALFNAQKQIDWYLGED
ncbi:MAG: hypothetical protein ACLBM6_13795 [Cuspidothrix sp.]